MKWYKIYGIVLMVLLMISIPILSSKEQHLLKILEQMPTAEEMKELYHLDQMYMEKSTLKTGSFVTSCSLRYYQTDHSQFIVWIVILDKGQQMKNESYPYHQAMGLNKDEKYTDFDLYHLEYTKWYPDYIIKEYDTFDAYICFEPLENPERLVELIGKKKTT